MIAKLKGVLDSIEDGFVVVDVNGVGYQVFCSLKTQTKLGSIGQAVSLLTEMQVREDSIKLFGFADATEKSCFSLLTTVQGVGAKVALAILSSLTAQEVSMALYASDAKALTRAPGVGAKLAARIVSELKGKTVSVDGGTELSSLKENMTASSSSIMTDAMSALVNLGYQRMDAASAVNKAMKKCGEKADVATLIKEALKEFAL